jgi:hypothetical protein
VKREIRTAEAASEEFTAAVRWYEERRAGLGAEFLNAVSATMALIIERPEVGPPLEDGGITRRM